MLAGKLKMKNKPTKGVTNHTPVRAGCFRFQISMLCFALFCSHFCCVVVALLLPVVFAIFRLLVLFFVLFIAQNCTDHANFKYWIAFYYVFVSLSQKWEIVSIFIVVFWSSACVFAFSFPSGLLRSPKLFSFYIRFSLSLSCLHAYSPHPYCPYFSSLNHLYFDFYNELISKWNHIFFPAVL